MSDSELIQIASSLAEGFRPARTCTAGDVAAALRTVSGNVYTGICIDASCSIGFRAEHAAVAEMLKARETRIATIVAVDDEGRILPPCGRCRELLWQVDERNASTKVLIAPGQSVQLDQLLPHQYQGLVEQPGKGP